MSPHLRCTVFLMIGSLYDVALRCGEYNLVRLSEYGSVIVSHLVRYEPQVSN